MIQTRNEAEIGQEAALLWGRASKVGQEGSGGPLDNKAVGFYSGSIGPALALAWQMRWEGRLGS